MIDALVKRKRWLNQDILKSTKQEHGTCVLIAWILIRLLYAVYNVLKDIEINACDILRILELNIVEIICRVVQAGRISISKVVNHPIDCMKTTCYFNVVFRKCQ
jgi:hypothetical protein